MTGKKDSRLIPKIVPNECLYEYNLFIDLNKTRIGTDPIQYSEIKAYCELIDIELSKVTIDAIKMFDTALLNKRAELMLQEYEEE